MAYSMLWNREVLRMNTHTYYTTYSQDASISELLCR